MSIIKKMSKYNLRDIKHMETGKLVLEGNCDSIGNCLGNNWLSVISPKANKSTLEVMI